MIRCCKVKASIWLVIDKRVKCEAIVKGLRAAACERITIFARFIIKKKSGSALRHVVVDRLDLIKQCVSLSLSAISIISE